MLAFNEPYQRWLAVLLTVATFFLLLGTRPLNEPDEGRYAEVAREMVETGNWLVPHFWYLPHLDKPPMTYWCEAVSLKLFGLNEWAVRLPVALAAISGLWATFLLGRAIAGARTGWISILLLQTSFLYFVMSRFLTTDIFLTQFVTWAMYFFWESWQELRTVEPRWGKFLSWHLPGWVAIGLAFLVKGPVGFAIPVVALLALAVFRRRQLAAAKMFYGGMALGLVLMLVLILPWFLAVFHQEPRAAHYMIFGQAVGHLLGTTITNRRGNLFYFFGILAVGLLPWSFLLGWLWRRAHWRSLNERAQDAWLLLSVWAIFTFTLFSLSHAKLPAYILPIFPALVILLAIRFFSETAVETGMKLWRRCLAGAFILPAIFPLILKFAFNNAWSARLVAQTILIGGLGALIVWLSKNWAWPKQVMATVTVALAGLMLVVAEMPQYDSTFRANQTLKPMAGALSEHFQPGTQIVCWGKLPQGLPFYANSLINVTNRPFFGGMDWTQVPFEYPDNNSLAGPYSLHTDQELTALLQAREHVLIVAFGNSLEAFQSQTPVPALKLLAESGQWKLFESRQNQ